MLTMDTINSIREDYYSKGKSIKQIADETGHDRKTIRKYINKDDFSETSPKPRSPEDYCPPKLLPYKEIIDGWLIKDKEAKRKQRHTAKRVHDRLRKEKATKDTYDCSYRTVAIYVKAKKKEIFNENTDAAIPLEHKYGEAQLDFGDAQFYENGMLWDGKYLNIAFPKSNQGFMQLFRGENAECLFEGMINIFNYIGGVPTAIWFDNMSPVVKKILRGGGRDLTEKFLRFANHYRFKSIFCNPDAGNEKGCVENKVGYHRRNMLVPLPEFDDLAEYNKELLPVCEANGKREHYRHNEQICDLFTGDKAKLLTLPGVELDVSDYIHPKTDKYGRFYLNDKRHEYSTAPKYALSRVVVKLTSEEVIILDNEHKEIIKHRRLYGDKKLQSMQWLPYLSQLAKRPRALKYTGIYEMMPEDLQNLINGLGNGDAGKVLQMIADITDKSDFDKAMDAVNSAISLGASDADSLLSIHRRLTDNVPDMPQITSNIAMIDKNRVIMPDLKAYELPTINDGGDIRG